MQIIHYVYGMHMRNMWAWIMCSKRQHFTSFWGGPINIYECTYNLAKRGKKFTHKNRFHVWYMEDHVVYISTHKTTHRTSHSRWLSNFKHLYMKYFLSHKFYTQGGKNHSTYTTKQGMQFWLCCSILELYIKIFEKNDFYD